MFRRRESIYSKGQGAACHLVNCNYSENIEALIVER